MDLREAPAVAHAEVEEVWPRDGCIRIVGRLTEGVPGGGSAALVLRARGGEEELRLPTALGAQEPAEGDGPRFDVRIPLAALAAASTGPGETWDLYLSHAGTRSAVDPTVDPADGASVGPAGGAGDKPADEPLRLGRHLDDVPGKKKVFVYPSQTEAGRRIEPFYTIRDNLSVRCRPAGTGEEAA